MTIQDCVVEGPVKGGAGAYATCIAAAGPAGLNFPAAGSSARLFNNRVVGVTNGIAYGIGGLNAILEGNFASGCAKALNTDVSRQENIIIRGNVIRDLKL